MLGFVLTHEPHELCRSDLGADRQDVGVFRVMGRVPMPPRAPAGQDPGEPLLDAAHDVRHVLVGGRVLPEEARALSIGAWDEDPVGDHRVGVRVEARAVREALNLQETAGLRVCDAEVVGPLALPAREFVGEDPEDRCRELSVEGDHARELSGEREDPLAVRYLWQNAIHQVRRLLVHAPARAGRAEPHLA